MLFNSILFLIFFSVVYIIYWLLPGRRRQDFLLFSSALFYVISASTIFGGLGFLAHFIAIILTNYFAYYRIRTSNHKKGWMIFAVLLNVINLGFFKYFYFINRILADITGYPFFEEVPRILKISLPLAVSFYSFQMIASAIDAYRKPEGEVLTLKQFFSFVLFFPILIVGPILRMKDFFPNLEQLSPSKEKIIRAGYLMISGLIKKIMVADPVANVIAPVFANPGQYDNLSLVLAGFGYTIQVYCDFSGLTDMARSVGLMLGFELPENFKAPLFSPSGRELWQRWHMTLSFWLRDYVYFSLGGSKTGEWRTYLNLIITMTVGGIWHGADYTFIAWGFYWGVILAAERFFVKRFGWDDGESSNRFLNVIRVQIIFVLFSFSAILFRSNSAGKMVQHVVGLIANLPGKLSGILMANGSNWIDQATSLVSGPSPLRLERMENMEKLAYSYLAFLFFHFVQYKPERIQKIGENRTWIFVICAILTVFAITLYSEDSSVCIYCQF
ncbi:putative alginate O-acetyltransferase AlgI [Leptospira fainei serovar Hurstbridge str. BUT 6]|uniref:Alginate O-acetyltransferase AlgI n=1 Tax=Leptospira fainei serovar Hurstbridge str. BUT 6 TaxID=1193011 RepID=S3V4X7_9LEPT|nr:MBOAT family O-acyltransferase [Leptospira fainei]EPG75659.1 putative alginate O-acetyltransferase AlgI [Leptospira fainei serovar Hurstbridge str. BUT 6]